MEDELEPCPFCGEVPQVNRYGVVMHACRILDKEIRVPISRWNRRSGQTCHVKSSRTEWEDGDYSYLEVELSCGHAFTWDDVTPPDFCPRCGARVVSE